MLFVNTLLQVGELYFSVIMLTLAIFGPISMIIIIPRGMKEDLAFYASDPVLRKKYIRTMIELYAFILCLTLYSWVYIGYAGQWSST